MMHLERARAESFGNVAESYDRYRPDVPDALIEDLIARKPTRALDIGTGTGKVAVALAKRGLDVMGVEVDSRMAKVARDRGITVEIAKFEDWEDEGRRFDLVTCGDAWHWIDPKRGAEKVASVLRAGGTMAQFWNCLHLEDSVIAAVESVYREHAPTANLYGRLPALTREQYFPLTSADYFPAGDAFPSVETKTYEWTKVFELDDWIHFLATVSDHQRLGSAKLANLQDRVRETLRRIGDQVHTHGRTYASFAQRT